MGLLSRILGFFSGAKDEAATAAKDVSNQAAEVASSAMDQMKDHASGAVEQATDAAHELIDQAKEMVGEQADGLAGAATTAATQAISKISGNSDSTEEEISMSLVSMVVNGLSVSGDVEDRTLLSSFLRDELRLTGTHVGCDTSQCGACVIHVDGKAVKSCTMLAVQADGCEVTTIEGLGGSDGSLHPMQAAFKEHHGLQCGFCTPGMIMSAVDMAKRHGGKLDEATIRSELEGNICRCTGYHNIVKAIEAGAEASA